MMRAVALALAALVGLGPGLARAETPCRQALALGMDVSASVDAAEYRLQRDGLAHALLDPAVVAAFTALPDAPVTLMIFEWSGYRSQTVLLPWTPIRSRDDLRAAASVLAGPSGPRNENATAIGGAALFAARAFGQVGDCWRKTLDLSGDGKNNDGPTPGMLAQDPRLDGITINGLVIGAGSGTDATRRNAHIGEMVAYFQRHVIRGPGAFTEVALGFEGFEMAMRRKLLREIRVLQFSELASGPR
ncbi:protein of unknown function DUF1194 [Dinoroseobacter shibae DFL 12 = DSM 16493]|jgi:hypothetical protein|uniref:VWFA domain-containing protein n=2 Tax=Dinoroseobacter shibae TaxID=215813 RepID=A8LQW8_DINSH|nr:protein of unknown function DUF1194 [Dinoroseobacter shibae DFL 12 = DSM 16493]